MSRWAIEFIDHSQFSELDYEFYTGTSYVYQGCRYAVSDRQKPKLYENKKRADNDLNKAMGNFENFWKGRLVEILDE